MKKRYLYIIPLFLVELMLQMLFFWLAPETAAKWIVYSIVTVMTIAHLILTFVLIFKYGIRRAAAPVTAGTFVQFLIVGSAVFLLIVAADVRNALFLLFILSILYITVILLLGLSMEDKKILCSADDGYKGDDNYERSMNERNVRTMTPPPLPVRR